MTIAKLLAQFAAKGGKIKKFKAQGVPKPEKICLLYTSPSPRD